MADWKALAKNPEEYAKVRHDDPRLDAFAGEVERRYGLPPNIILALKNAGERSQSWQESPAGAKGVMQFIDSTRRSYEHDYKNPFASIDAAGRYFKDLIDRYDGNVKAAVVEYNGGVRQAQQVLKGGEPWAKETIDYWKRVRDFGRKQNRGE